MVEESIFFATNKREAIAYAHKVNKKEGYTAMPIRSIRLATKQKRTHSELKTWACDIGEVPKSRSWR